MVVVEEAREMQTQLVAQAEAQLKAKCEEKRRLGEEWEAKLEQQQEKAKKDVAAVFKFIREALNQREQTLLQEIETKSAASQSLLAQRERVVVDGIALASSASSTTDLGLLFNRRKQLEDASKAIDASWATLQTPPLSLVTLTLFVCPLHRRSLLVVVHWIVLVRRFHNKQQQNNHNHSILQS